MLSREYINDINECMSQLSVDHRLNQGSLHLPVDRVHTSREISQFYRLTSLVDGGALGVTSALFTSMSHKVEKFSL